MPALIAVRTLGPPSLTMDGELATPERVVYDAAGAPVSHRRSGCAAKTGWSAK